MLPPCSVLKSKPNKQPARKNKYQTVWFTDISKEGAAFVSSVRERA
jgi:hypothetical protein